MASSITVDFNASLARFTSSVDKATNDLAKFQTNAERMSKNTSKAFDGMGRSIASFKNNLLGIAGGFAVGFGVKEIVRLADTYNLLSDRIGIVTKTEEERIAVEKELFDISQRTRTAYESTLTLYARMARSSENLGVSQENLLKITETINKSMIVSGASTQEASAAMVQFSQALASGELRGEELRSVMEQTPRLAKAIADGLGVTIGKLREMSKDGELTANKVTTALLSQKDIISREYSKIGATVGQSILVMENSLGRLLHRTDESGKATNILAKEIIKVSESLDKWGDKNQKLIEQKVPEYVQKVYSSVKGLIGLFDGLPDGSTKAVIVGLLTGKVFGPAVGASVGAGMFLGDRSRESTRQKMRDYSTMPDSSFADELGPRPDFEEADRLRDWIQKRDALIKEMQQQDEEISFLYSKTEFVGPPSPKELPPMPTIAPPKPWEKDGYSEEANAQWADFNRMLSEGEQLMRSVQTPTEEYAASIEHLNFLYREAVIDQETFARATKKAAEDYAEANDKVSESMWALKNVGANEEWAEFNALQEETAAIFRSVRTPAEEYAVTLERLNSLLKNTDSGMTLETYDRAVSAATEDFNKATEKLEEDTFGARMEHAMDGWASNFSSTLNDMLWDADATFGDIAESFARMVTQMMIQQQIVEPFVKGIRPALKGVGTALQVLFSANGNVLPGGFKAFASGSPYVNTPTLGMIGEGQYPEAVIPLPDGRTVPVTMKGGGGGDTFEQYISIDARGATPGTEMRIRQAAEEGARRGYEMVLADMKTRGQIYQRAQH